MDRMIYEQHNTTPLYYPVFFLNSIGGSKLKPENLEKLQYALSYFESLMSDNRNQKTITLDIEKLIYIIRPLREVFYAERKGSLSPMESDPAYIAGKRIARICEDLGITWEQAYPLVVSTSG